MLLWECRALVRRQEEGSLDWSCQQQELPLRSCSVPRHGWILLPIQPLLQFLDYNLVMS